MDWAEPNWLPFAAASDDAESVNGLCAREAAPSLGVEEFEEAQKSEEVPSALGFGEERSLEFPDSPGLSVWPKDFVSLARESRIP